ncbi:Dyp-type peroxidase [Fodinicola acaciae]|uniref:Dyp-type peroxidase n=1 Tax=Fodinicola acaciae TaxID=2681555 RepID=UPI0013D45D97|nr:Dyp-type peroxidase [Fodinicola acaciae]
MAIRDAARKMPNHQPGITSVPPRTALFIGADITPGALEHVFRAANLATPDAEVTIAVGASLFDRRFGLAKQRPRQLTTMPSFPNDLLDPAQCHGDLLLQICADNPHAAEATWCQISAAAKSRLRERWRIDGFRDQNTIGTTGQCKTRDLFGFREGAGNPDTNNPGVMNQFVWTANDGSEPDWAAGGSYQVIRRIQFAPTLWASEPLERQEAIIGRRKIDGAPLGHDHEDSPFDYANDPYGRTIPLDAHIRRANPRTPQSQSSRILRRGYSYRRGTEPEGNPEEGLIFVCFQRDLRSGFETIQRRLVGQALDRYILPIGGGYFFALPGRTSETNDYVGRPLLSPDSITNRRAR